MTLGEDHKGREIVISISKSLQFNAGNNIAHVCLSLSGKNV